MSHDRHFKACEVCGKWRGKGRDHARCSEILKQVGPKHEHGKYKKFKIEKFEHHLARYLEDNGETPPYLETALDYRTLERLKNGG